jgi:adenine C2-methylase RlmN of 23S rRNA A2503 and tRNA A37
MHSDFSSPPIVRLAGLPFQSPSAERALAFQNAVRLADIPVYIRNSRGSDAAAARWDIPHPG